MHFLTAGSPESEDILHQAFLLAHDRLASGEDFQVSPEVWLRGTVRNLVYAWWRQKRKLPQNLADGVKLLADEADDHAAGVTWERLKEALRKCLEKLAPEDRQLVRKRYQEPLAINQIAKEMQRNPATVRVRLFRIRGGLKRCVEAVLSQGGAS